MLDADLNLYQFIVNEEKKCFDLVDDEFIKLGEKLRIDSQWLKFNNKPLSDFEFYK